MNKTIVKSVLLLALVNLSCKKERTCICTVNNKSTIDGKVTVSGPLTDTLTYKEVTKRQVKSICANIIYNTNSSAGNSTEYSRTCVIK